MKLYITYYEEDRKWLYKLITSLKILQRTKLIASIWSRKDIQAGMEAQVVIDEAIRKADIALVLLSSEYLNSDQCYEEMEKVMSLQRQKRIRVIPIILRDCLWHELPELEKLNVLPKAGIPIKSKDWPNEDKPYTQIAKEIRKVATQLKEDKLKKPPPIPPARKAFINEFNYLRKTLQSALKRIYITPDLERHYSLIHHINDIKDYAFLMSVYDRHKVNAKELAFDEVDYFLAGLGLKLQTQDKRIANAIYYFEKAIKLKPNYAEAYVYKGLAYIKLNNYELAIDAYENALSLSGGYALAYYHLAVVHSFQKNKSQVLNYLEEACSLDYKLRRYAIDEPAFTWLSDDQDFIHTIISK